MSNDHISLAGTKAKGKRPQYFELAESERLMSILLAVAGELAVTRERLDTMERLLEQKGLLSTSDIETFEPDSEASEARALLHQEYIARILRIVQQEKEAINEQKSATDATSLESVIQELAEI
ncbi:hypothetical protein [uncultured Microbulbifer sp.]|uniref:hypothetical protein n=1 Tax=uncultured Microbulbifer sp. TaxID=348147 RepID=UPI002637E871|nr:hypothetical protein [uncultured Microbulbifer sp.]